MTWTFVLQLIVLALVATFLITVVGAMFRTPGRRSDTCLGQCCNPNNPDRKGNPPW